MKINTQRTFNNPEFGSVRMLETDDGKILFCGADVAHALGYTNSRKAIADHCKKDGVTKRYIIDRMGRRQQTNFITEGNVYRLITHSKLPNAEKFESWLFDEVLPVLRQNQLFMKNPLEWAKHLTNGQKYDRIETEQTFSNPESLLLQKEIAGNLSTIADNTTYLKSLDYSIAQLYEVVKPFLQENFKKPKKRGKSMQTCDLDTLKCCLPQYAETITEKRRYDKYNCPLCGSGTRENGTPAFHLYQDKKKAHCFSCGFDGSIIDLYLAYHQMAQSRENASQAIRALSEEFGLTVPPPAPVQKKEMPKEKPRKIGQREHIYRNADGSIFGKKTIVSYSDGSKAPFWALFDPVTGNYVNGLKGQKAPLYNADLLQSSPDEPVYITEGEKDAETIINFQGIATTIPNGAGFSQWIPIYNEGLQGRDIIILTDNDSPGRAYGKKVARHVFDIAKSVKVIPAESIWNECPEKGDITDIAQALGEEETIQRLTDAIRNAGLYIPEPEEPEQMPLPEKEIAPLEARKGYEFERRSIRYVWYPYIPAGDYTVLMAAGGTGKTFFACGMASTLSRGEALPVPAEYAEKSILPENRNVLIISAEDRGSDLWGRLEKAGADPEYVRIADKTSSNGFLFPKDSNDITRIQILEQTIEKYQPNLIIIDPWHAFCPPEIDVNRINHVRPLFQTLSAVCERFDCGLVLISHVNKRAQENANNAALGSVDLVNASRSALTVISDGRDQNSRLVVQTKSNHAPHGQTVKFTIDDGSFAWDGFEPGLTKDTLEEAAKRHRKPTALIQDKPDYTELKADLLERITELTQPGKETRIAYQQLEDTCENEMFRTLQTSEKKNLIAQVVNSEAFRSRGMTFLDYIRNVSYTDSLGIQRRGRGFNVSRMVTPHEMAAAMPK